MNKRPGEVRVTTEVGYCNFCGRTRNLRHEEHVLGTLVRTIVTCESCHRTLSSTIGVTTPEPRVEEPVQPSLPAQAPEPAPKPAAKTARATKPAAKKPASAKVAAKKSPVKTAAASGKTKGTSGTANKKP